MSHGIIGSLTSRGVGRATGDEKSLSRDLIKLRTSIVCDCVEGCRTFVLKMITWACYYNVDAGHYVVDILCSPRHEIVLRAVLECIYSICECMNINCSCASPFLCPCTPYAFRINNE